MTYKKFTFVDLFSGIGGFRIGLEKLGGQCVGFSEIDKQAIEVYKQNFNTKILTLKNTNKNLRRLLSNDR